MSTRSLRNRVSSRYTSPTIAAELDGAVGQTEDVQSRRNGEHAMADDWVEPPIRKLPPSYQDHRGLERVGVLELQEPLGVPPSQKLLQKLKLTFNRPSPRATPMQSEGFPTPSVEIEKVDLVSPLEADISSEQTQPFPLLQHQQQPEEPITISSPPRGRPAKKDVAEMKHSIYPIDLTTSPVKSSFTTPTTYVSPKPVSIQEHLRQDRLQNYVEKAINEAEKRGDPGLVPGLRRLREAAHANHQLWNVLDAIVHKTPSDQQLRTFKRYIKKGVKRHLKELRASESSFEASPSINNFDSPGQPTRSLTDTIPVLSPPVAAANHPSTFTSPFRTRPTPPISHAAYPPTIAYSMSGPLVPEVDMEAPPIENGQLQRTNSRKRSRSASTSSSLSSAKSIPEEFAPVIDVDSGTQSADGRSSRAAGQRQGTHRDVAGRGLRASGANQYSQSNKYASKKLKKSQDDSEFDLEELSRRKQRFAVDSFHDYNQIPRPEVNDRYQVDTNNTSSSLPLLDSSIPAPVIHPNSLNPTIALASPLNSQHRFDNVLPNGIGRKRTYSEIDKDDYDDLTPQSSSPGPVFVPPPPIGVSANLRGATPRAAKPPAVNRARKSARVMVSPNKPKNGGITAGIARAGPARDSMIGDGGDSGPEDNDEYCASCGGEGKLLCCDGCTNSFHHACLEPPLDPDEEVDGEWFCPRCIAKRNKEAPPINGLLGQVIRRVDDTIPKAYALPLAIREYFEGVRTGDEGEYEEVGLPRTQNNVLKMNRAGFIDEPNYKDLRDSKGKLITCYRCHLTADGRDIIPCDFCPAKWHLDCIDPPLAIPPRRRIGDKPNATWRCPLHAEHDLTAIGRQAEAAPGDLGRVPRLRRPKNAFSVDPTVSRGFKNNGVIDVELMKDEMPEIKEIDMGGGTFRLPEQGIRLDFIDRVKRSWYEDQTFPTLMGRPQKLREKLYRPGGAVLYHPPQYTLVKYQNPDFFTSAQAIAIAETAKANAVLRRKSFKEQQAVLNLASLSRNGELHYSGDHLADLTNQLVSEAPQATVDAIQRSERDSLIELQALIDRRLQLLDNHDGQAHFTTGKGGANGSIGMMRGGDAMYHDYDLSYGDSNDADSEMGLSD